MATQNVSTQATESKILSARNHCEHCHGPSKCAREIIYWQLTFLSTVIGNWEKLDDYNGEDIAGLATLVSDIAKKVFPE